MASRASPIPTSSPADGGEQAPSSNASVSGLLIRQPDDAGIAAAIEALRTGGLVAFPTETVYGLGADATADLAVAAIFAAKQRPSFNPLIVHVAEIAMAKALARFDERATHLARLFWPGPLTLVLPRLPTCPVSLLASA